MKKLLILFCCLLIVIPPFTYVQLQPVEAASSNIQTLSVDVVSQSVNANPYVAYWELDNGSFRAANSYTGDKTVASSGGLPIVSEMAQRLSMSDYPADYYTIKGNEGVRFPQSAVSNKMINTIIPGNNTTQAYSEPPSHQNIIAYSKTGGTDPARSCAPYNSTGKLECTYPYSFVLTYKGKVEVTKRITAKSDSTIGVGDTVNVTASIATKEGASASFGSETDVTYRTNEVTWNSDKKAVATVDSTGKVTGVSKGTAQVCATWTKEDQPFGKWNIVDCVTITVTDDGGLAITGGNDVCIKAGETKKIKLSAKLTKADGSVHDLSTGHPKLTYTSSNTTIGTVISNGEVTIKGIGTVTITAKFIDTTQKIDEKKEVTIVVTDCDKPGGNPGGGGACTRDFVESGGTTMNSSYTTATPEGSVSANDGVYDVVQGIPSSESLRVDATSEEYLYDQEYKQRAGNVVFNNINAEKTFTLTWTETTKGADGKEVKTPKSETETVETTVSGIERPFSYWEVLKLDVWKLDNGVFTNYALPNGTATAMSSVSFAVSATHSDPIDTHVFPEECPDIVLPGETIDGGSSKPSVPSIDDEARSEAESKIGQNQVQNDSVNFKDSTLMDDGKTEINGPTPSNVPTPGMITISSTNLLIDPLKTNYWQSPSTGVVNYTPLFSLTNSAGNLSFDFAVNNVTVHTPVVIYAKASDDKEHDQRINPPLRSTPPNPDTDRHAFILDRPFTVTLPTSGQHRNIPGYGNRDYSKYIKKKQVLFPFDVYTETKLGYYPANTWIDVPVDMESVNFFMPVWVPEGQYTIQFRSFAINALETGDFGGTEEKANITIPNPIYNVVPAGTQSAAHVAVTSIEVDVVGRLYDFQVTDIDDYNWKNVFRNTDMTMRGNSYYVGKKGIDNATRGNQLPYVLPISHASNPNGIKNLAVKTGYDFNFNFKTKGDMQSIDDAVRIKPTFYFVNKDGSNRQQVDLYYHDNNKKFIKIGSNEDQTYRTVKLNETSRNVDINEITNNAYHYFDKASRFNLGKLASEHTKTSFARNYVKHLSKEATKTGPYGWQVLNWQLRTYRGPLQDKVPAKTMIPRDEVVTKEQTWYSEYSLPANTYVVAKDAKIHDAGRIGQLNENHPIFLTDGYIIVNFDLETINEGNLANPYLSYYNAHYMSQWTDMEEFQTSFVDGYGNTFANLEGDVIYYHANQSSLDDFSASVTH